MGFLDKRKFEAQVIGDRIVWEGEGEVAWLEPWGENAIRFRSSKSLRIDKDLNWTLLDPGSSDEVEISVDEDKAIMRNGLLSAEIDGDGVVRYFNDEGELLREYWKDPRVGHILNRRAREFKSIASESFEVHLYFHANEGEHFYGLGQDANDRFDLKGSTVELLQKNTKCTIPFVYSSIGYGFIWNNPAVGRVELVGNHTLWRAQAAKQIDYIIIAGDSPAQIMGSYTALTGRAPMLPQWAVGFWQSKLRYVTQEELLEVAREYKQRNLPVSVIVADYFHWPQQGDWKFDPTYWPNPEAMVDELKQMGMRLMVSVWPTVDVRSENHSEMLNRNMTIRAERGVSVFLPFLGYETYVDTTHPEARRFLWSKIKRNYYDYGIRMFWLDEAEPEMRPYDYENVRYYAGNGLEVSNIYPFRYAEAFHDGMRAQGEQEIVNLVRCAWLGSQRLGVVLWSGDIESDFPSLRKQIKVGLHTAMCGIPWWTSDIGGFLQGDPDCPRFRELIVRWFQFGAFCPIFRLHGYRLPYKDADYNDPTTFCNSGGPNEVWSFGEEAYSILSEFMAIRERLTPYIMEQMRHAADTGAPVMRPLFYDFPDDDRVYAVGDQYMFGPDLMVAPVYEEGAVSRHVYLPGEVAWTDARSGEELQGGRTVDVDAPLETLPLFFRDAERLPVYS